jgi:hypothetical protein
MQPPSRSRSYLRVRKALAGLITGAILVLALLAGRFLFLGELIIETHGYIGNGLFLLTLVNLGLAFVDDADGSQLAVAGLIALLSFTQIGLGYVGRDTLDAAALHVPNGVLLMGLAAYQYSDLRTRAAVLQGS